MFQLADIRFQCMVVYDLFVGFVVIRQMDIKEVYGFICFFCQEFQVCLYDVFGFYIKGGKVFVLKVQCYFDFVWYQVQLIVKMDSGFYLLKVVFVIEFLNYFGYYV